ncbi:hypothetical protein BYT27DRAFT_7224773 [Phlegmacium glaucopus]|nr:hypothetical protein BYT27DRAFT_7224773 [Phlegmacium glaucopus]
MRKSPPIHHLVSPLRNGNKFSKEIPSTLTRSSCHSTILSLMKRERVAWETQKCLSVFQSPKNMLEHPRNGRPPGDKLQKQFPSLSPIVEMNCSTTGTTLKKNLQPKYHHPTTGSSCTISHSETKSALANTPFLPTPTNSLDFTPPSSCQTESNLTLPQLSPKDQATTFKPPENQTFATSSTMEPANSLNPIAGIDTYAKTARNQDTPARIAREGAAEIYGVQPKYLRHNLWEEPSVLSPTTAEWFLYASPLPCPPLSEIMNPVVQITPIKVDVFESLLVNHPNQPFVRSGFWLWADTLCDNFPATHDQSRPDPFNPKKSNFILDQCAIKIKKGRFSLSFGPDLLPGIAGPFSLNSMINHTKVTGFPLDNLRQLSEILLNVKKSIGNIPVTMWKSDIAKAYRLMPVHPCWQIKQINTIGSQRFVDHNLAFGSSGSPGIFISFNSLVAWITKYVKLFDYLANYVDNLSGCDVTSDTLFYAPYNCYLPSHQKQLFDLWDELGIPHKPHKQLSGSPLTIIGIDVNPNSMTLSLPPSSKSRLLNELLFWSSKPPKRSDQRIYINNAICNDFLWALHHIDKSNGVHLLKSTFWAPTEANFTIFCDACPEGMGFWYPDNKTGFYAPTPINVPSDFIFYFEALCVLSALDHVQSCAPNRSQIVIYTDNLNTVYINDFSLWVLHVPGSENIIADALSQVKFSVALLHKPLLNLYTFNPRSDSAHARPGLETVLSENEQ